VVAHLLVDVQVRGARGVEAGQQLVDHDEQTHLTRLLDEAALDLLLELVDPTDSLVRRHTEEVGQHPPIDVVLTELLGGALARVLLGDVARVRRVARDDGDLVFETRVDEHLVELAGLVDALTYQHCVAATAHQPWLGFHVQQDVLDDLLGPGLSGYDLLHRAPLLLQAGLAQVGEALGLGLEPLVDLFRAGQVLIYVACLVAQVEDDAVRHGLIELVGVDERAEGLDARCLVCLQQRRPGEADEHRLRQ